MKKIILLSVLILTFFVLFQKTSPSRAQEVKEASPDGQVSEEINGTNNEHLDSIRKKVRERVEQAKKGPKAYIGTITDISKDSLQIKNVNEEIQLIALNANETSFVKINSSSKKVSFEDLAIGDFTIAMGFRNETDVLDATRVLITSPIEPPMRTSVFGEITDIGKKQITLKQKGDEELVLSFPKTWKGPEIDELEEGMKIIAVYESDEEELVIRTIEIIDNPTNSPTPTK